MRDGLDGGGHPAQAIVVDREVALDFGCAPLHFDEGKRASAPGETEASAEDADTLLREALGRLKPSHAAAEVAKATGLDRKALYARALKLK